MLASSNKIARPLAVYRTVKDSRGSSTRRADTRAIKKRLIDHDLTMTGLARELGFTRDYVWMLVHNRRCCLSAQCCIAQALKMPLDEAFPDGTQ